MRRFYFFALGMYLGLVVVAFADSATSQQEKLESLSQATQLDAPCEEADLSVGEELSSPCEILEKADQ